MTAAPLTVVGWLTLAGAARGQIKRKPVRIGYISGASAANDAPLMAAFHQAMNALGRHMPADYVVEARYTTGRDALADGLVAELIQLGVDLFLAYGAVAAQAAVRAGGGRPVILTNVADPVAVGLAASLARPGGPVTGLADDHVATITKRLELIKELVPSLSRVAVLYNPGNAHNLTQLDDLDRAAATLRLTLAKVPARLPDEIGAAFDTMRAQGAAGLVIVGDAMLSSQQDRIAALAIDARLPAIYGIRSFVKAGGLLSYGADFTVMWRRAAWYVDRVIQGANPADLPIEQPTRFELAINLRAAKALGLVVPATLVERADEVIE